MGTVLASKIAADAAKVLFDTGYDRILEADHLNFINAGQIQASIIKPDIKIQNGACIMIAGTKQAVSSTGTVFIGLTRNMGTNGLVPGAPIYFIDMDVLNIQNSDWHTDTASATIELYTYNPKDPKVFYVYPPQPAAGQGYADQVEAIMPVTIGAIGSAITIDDIYETALFHYDLYRAYSIEAKQSKEAGNRASFHYSMFFQLLTGKQTSESRTEKIE